MASNVCIFSTGTDYVETAYSDAVDGKRVKYYGKNIIGLYNRFCQIFHMKPLSIIYKVLYASIIMFTKRSSDLLIIYHGIGMMYLVNNGFLDYVRKHRPFSYHVLVVWDSNDIKNLQNLDAVKSKVDEIVTHDEKLADKYDITYYPLFYSKTHCVESGIKDNQLVFFCGEDRGRLELLKKIAELFSNNGIKYSFFCYNSEEEYTDEFGIQYIKRMDHSEYIKRLAECSIVLDIVKPGATGQTLRFCEAVLYDTRILSNNPAIETLVCFDADNMCLFNNVDDINLEFVKNSGQVNYKNKDSISPVTFIKFLSDKAKGRSI